MTFCPQHTAMSDFKLSCMKIFAPYILGNQHTYLEDIVCMHVYIQTNTHAHTHRERDRSDISTYTHTSDIGYVYFRGKIP